MITMIFGQVGCRNSIKELNLHTYRVEAYLFISETKLCKHKV